jgi:hypothetical protein
MSPTAGGHSRWIASASAATCFRLDAKQQQPSWGAVKERGTNRQVAFAGPRPSGGAHSSSSSGVGRLAGAESKAPGHVSFSERVTRLSGRRRVRWFGRPWIGRRRIALRARLGSSCPRPGAPPGGHSVSACGRGAFLRRARRPGLPGAHLDQVRFEFGDHRQDVEQESAHGVVRVVDRAAEVEPDLEGRELVDDVAGVWERPGQAGQLVTTRVSPERQAPVPHEGRGAPGWCRSGRGRRRSARERRRALPEHCAAR